MSEIIDFLGMYYYGIVRYLYIIFDRILNTMQGVRQAIMQDMQILKKSQKIQSSVSAVECYVCGKGLQDDVHYSLQ